MRRALPAVLMSTILATATAQVAYADDATDFTALETCAGASSATAALTQDVTSASVLSISCDLTLDLQGHTLDVTRIVIGSGHALSLEDSGETGRLEATGAEFQKAGIEVPAGSEIVINGGTVNATSGYMAAGIGGSYLQDAGTIVINGGTITATSGSYSAGIGGGRDGSGGSITVTDGTVVATGGSGGGAGIGGGQNGDSGTVTITDGTVTAVGGSYGAGIGGGDGGDAETIDIQGGYVSATGGGAAAGIGGGSSSGSGATVSIVNAVVDATGGNSSAGIGGGYPEGAGGDVTIGMGAIVTAEGDSNALGAAAVGTVFGTLTLSGTLHVPSGDLIIPDSDAGAEVTIASTGKLLGIDGDETQGATISGDGQIDNGGIIALDESLVGVTVTDHTYLVTFDTQGGTDPDPVRAFATSFVDGYRTVPSGGSDLDWNTAADGTGDWFTSASALSFDTTVYAVTDATLTLTPSATTVDQGGTLTFAVTGVDHTGAPVDTSGVVLTSSVGTDQISGLHVTFPHASPHEITATLGSASATVTVEVTPVQSAPTDGTSDTDDETGDGTSAAGDSADSTGSSTGSSSDTTAQELAETGAQGTALLLGGAATLIVAGIGVLLAGRKEKLAGT